MRAAEQLFAEQGIDRVSLREIAVAAGQRNVSAATYHFGSKRELIEAILERHSRPVQDRWFLTLQGEAAGKLDLVDLIELMVKPIVAKVDDPDNGRCYLEMCAELVASRSFPLMEMRASTSPGAAELAKHIAQRGPQLPPLFQLIRSARLAGLLYGSIGDYLRLSASGLDISREQFVADLVNALVAAVRAPAPSQLTKIA
jgi:AcrR family transcriptional regulator